MNTLSRKQAVLNIKSAVQQFKAAQLTILDQVKSELMTLPQAKPGRLADRHAPWVEGGVVDLFKQKQEKLYNGSDEMMDIINAGWEAYLIAGLPMTKIKKTAIAAGMPAATWKNMEKQIQGNINYYHEQTALGNNTKH